MDATLQIVVRYGNAYGANHFAIQGGERTFCGRNRADWSVCREFEDDDLTNAFSCQRCVAAALKEERA